MEILNNSIIVVKLGGTEGVDFSSDLYRMRLNY